MSTQVHDTEATPKRRSPVRRTIEVVVGIGLAVGLLVWGLPYFAKTTWGDMLHVLAGIPLTTSLGLFALLVIGLWFYTFTFTGSLPGLKHWQALIVNVCGSSVGNLLPAGGAVGLAATYTILRSWGFSRRAISTSAIVTGVWNVLARLALPIIAILSLTVGANDVPQALKDAAWAGAAGGVGLVAAFVAVLVSQRAASAVGHVVDRIVRRVRPRPDGVGVEQLVADLRVRCLDIVQHGWVSMTFGMLGFFGVYFVLFWFTMDAVGVHMFFGQLFAAFAIGRLLTAVGITPGGVGVTESATVAALVAWGADGTAAAAGAILYSIYTHLLEVPLGGIGWVAWTLSPKSPAPEEPLVTGPEDLPIP